MHATLGLDNQAVLVPGAEAGTLGLHRLARLSIQPIADCNGVLENPWLVEVFLCQLLQLMDLVGVELLSELVEEDCTPLL